MQPLRFMHVEVERHRHAVELGVDARAQRLARVERHRLLRLDVAIGVADEQLPRERAERRGVGVVAAGGVGLDDAADVLAEEADRRALLVHHAPSRRQRADAIADLAGADAVGVAVRLDVAARRVRAAAAQGGGHRRERDPHPRSWWAYAPTVTADRLAVAPSVSTMAHGSRAWRRRPGARRRGAAVAAGVSLPHRRRRVRQLAVAAGRRAATALAYVPAIALLSGRGCARAGGRVDARPRARRSAPLVHRWRWWRRRSPRTIRCSTPPSAAPMARYHADAQRRCRGAAGRRSLLDAPAGDAERLARRHEPVRCRRSTAQPRHRARSAATI